jgi:UDP:flavonoid glycosyltransferase YjiC (YdhE family)
VPDWVTAERSRPLVYLTLGTYVHGHLDSLRAAMDGVAMLPVDALLTVGPEGDPASLEPAPRLGAGRALRVSCGAAPACRRRRAPSLTEPGYREAARRLRAEIAGMPAPAEVVLDLERRDAAYHGRR